KAERDQLRKEKARKRMRELRGQTPISFSKDQPWLRRNPPMSRRTWYRRIDAIRVRLDALRARFEALKMDVAQICSHHNKEISANKAVPSADSAARAQARAISEGCRVVSSIRHLDPEAKIDITVQFIEPEWETPGMTHDEKEAAYEKARARERELLSDT